MKDKRPLILVTNDDGIDSPGLAAAARGALRVDDGIGRHESAGERYSHAAVQKKDISHPADGRHDQKMIGGQKTHDRDLGVSKDRSVTYG